MFKAESVIDNLIVEYEIKLEKNMDETKICKESIAKKEIVIKLLSKKQDNLYVFSPNSKEQDIDTINLQVYELKEELDKLQDERTNLESNILDLKGIKDLISSKDQPNRGLNMLELQEQERQRIARDLHDSTVQNLASLIHKCDLCSRIVDTDPNRTRLELYTMSNTLKSIINEIRQIIYNLKPMSLEDLGLTVTVDRFINQLMMCHSIKIRLHHNDEEYGLLPIIKLSLFRMIQEACNNAIKHSEATTIDITLKYKEDSISVSVEDNGNGFNIESLKDCDSSDYHGYGLTIMKERVNYLSGTMKIESKIDKGTIVSINVPITKCKGEIYE